MRLIRAELLKARRRQATWVLLIVMLVLMTLVFVLGGLGFREIGLIEFPGVYALIGQFAFGLGGLLALVYAAAFIGADWNWGVLRNVISRGESRSAYLLAKAATLAILYALALVVIFVFGILMAYVTGALWNVPVANPLRGNGLADLGAWLSLTYPVLIQRAAIGLSVAVVLRSQLAGAIVGVLFFLGEPILRFIFTGLTFASRGLGGLVEGGRFQPTGPEWFQYLPVTVGDYVVNAAPGALSFQGALEGLFLRPVPLEQALTAVFVYLVITLGVAIFALNRQEIT